MGSLKPGATYVYEKAAGVTYAREFGEDPSTRFPIGGDPGELGTILGIKAKIMALYADMHLTAMTNPALHDALERAKLIYHLSRQDGQEQTR